MKTVQFTCARCRRGHGARGHLDGDQWVFVMDCNGARIEVGEVTDDDVASGDLRRFLEDISRRSLSQQNVLGVEWDDRRIS